jgi:hypothetical protein
MVFVYTSYDLINDRVWIIVRVGVLGNVHMKKNNILFGIIYLLFER